MGRVLGALNKDHEETRQRLIASITTQLLQSGGSPPSLRTLAEKAGVDPGTLRHYFGDRRGVVRAAFDHLLQYGQKQKDAALALSALPVREALITLLTRVGQAWPGALGGMHATGFAEGMADPELGQAYISNILEPTLATVEELLARFHGTGHLKVENARVSALCLMTPVFFGLFHQHQLQGRRCRPLELGPFIEAHVDIFLRGHDAKG